MSGGIIGCSLVIGIGLLRKSRLVRVLAVVEGFVLLLIPPIGTLIGIYILWLFLYKDTDSYFGKDTVPNLRSYFDGIKPDTSTTEPDHQPERQAAHKIDSTVLARASLICGILAFAMPFFFDVGFVVAAYITGRLVLRREGVPVKLRHLAKVGIGLGIGKLVYYTAMMVFLGMAFSNGLPLS